MVSSTTHMTVPEKGRDVCTDISSKKLVIKFLFLYIYVMKTELWEILVPASSNKNEAGALKFTYEHHKEWDEFVKDISGGLTIMKTAKGEWISPSGKLYTDRTIPCRIVCTEEQISEIIDFTIEHYSQEAVLAYKISDDVILRHKK